MLLKLGLSSLDKNGFASIAIGIVVVIFILVVAGGYFLFQKKEIGVEISEKG